ncbi:metabolite traffic protein EboE [Bremerella sp. JC817]|uniref:metabolite traffic protein EboE n=1 Tax=Bremerella sp. JC817 TaxID=3231756 RepID=UPI003459C2FF
MPIQSWTGYCTNVHAGANLEQTESNLNNHAARVQEILGKQQPLGIGLWLSNSTAAALVEPGKLDAFDEHLRTMKWIPYTFNGFPFGDFHKNIVKLDVYLPTWWQTERLTYTKNLVTILDRLLAPGEEGSISTMPLAWGADQPTEEQWSLATSNLLNLVDHLQQLEHQTGRLIYICIEPEPGCLLDTTEDVIEFFQNRLFPAGNPDQIRRYLRVCHDVCHAAVMFEDQSTVLSKYAEAGILIGKVQISSAIEIRFADLNENERHEVLAEVAQFAEDRYMHQTTVRDAAGNLTYYDDLPFALEAASQTVPQNETWRIHFHMPIYLDQFGLLKTTQAHIFDFLSEIRNYPDIRHFEVETYAWGVLPQELQHNELAEGIAQEIHWLRQQLSHSQAH